MKKIQAMGMIFRWNQILHERSKNKIKELMVLQSTRRGRRKRKKTKNKNKEEASNCAI